MVKRDLMRHIYCVCIGEANYLLHVLTIVFTNAEVTIGEVLGDLRSIILKRDLMRHIYCVCIGEANYRSQS